VLEFSEIGGVDLRGVPRLRSRRAAVAGQVTRCREANASNWKTQLWESHDQPRTRTTDETGRALVCGEDLNLADTCDSHGSNWGGRIRETGRGSVHGHRVRRTPENRDERWVDQVTQLEKVGLVRRRSCPSDVRGLLAVLTDKGHEALRRAAPGHVALVREFLIDVLTPDELTVLADAFDVVGGGQRGRDTA
jgi:hypothetical protein